MRLTCLFACASVLVVAPAVRAQSVISAHSGTVHFVEGSVTIDGVTIRPKFAQFPEIRNEQVLSTEAGRAEVLLTPGVFLRLQDHSSVRMVSNVLSDTRVALLSGVALIEVAELLPHNALTITACGADISLRKNGLYRIDATSASLRIFQGRAEVRSGDNKLIAKKNHEIALGGETVADAKFNPKQEDSFYQWSSKRASYIAAANETSARVASNSNSSSYAQSSWAWNPYFGMYTFLPGSGMYVSPFGPTYYSPSYVAYAYYPSRTSAGNGAQSAASAPVNSSSASGGVSRAGGGGAGMGGGGFGGSGGGGRMSSGGGVRR